MKVTFPEPHQEKLKELVEILTSANVIGKK